MTKHFFYWLVFYLFHSPFLYSCCLFIAFSSFSIYLNSGPFATIWRLHFAVEWGEKTEKDVWEGWQGRHTERVNWGDQEEMNKRRHGNFIVLTCTFSAEWMKCFWGWFIAESCHWVNETEEEANIARAVQQLPLTGFNMLARDSQTGVLPTIGCNKVEWMIMTGNFFRPGPLFIKKRKTTRRSIIVFLIMISIVIQRYFVVHLHNDLSMSNKSKAKPFFVCFFPTHLIPSPAWLHSSAAWWSHRLEVGEPCHHEEVLS